jgi:hypothetical protein
MKRISFYYSWTFPWRECEMCVIGPAVLNEGDKVWVGLGLFFLEVGILMQREDNEPDS